MERARATWTDERLDDLVRHMDGGFNRLDADMRAMRGELGGRLDGLAERVDALQRTMLQVGAGMIVTMIVGFAGVLVAQLS